MRLGQDVFNVTNEKLEKPISIEGSDPRIEEILSGYFSTAKGEVRGCIVLCLPTKD